MSLPPEGRAAVGELAGVSCLTANTTRPAAQETSEMNTEKPSILVIDDEPSLLRYFEYNIRSLGYPVRTGGSITELFAILEEEEFAVLLLDLMLPEGESIDKIPRLVKAYPRLSVVLVTAHGTIKKAVHSLRHGAVNFVQKPVNPETLESILENAVQIWSLKVENVKLRRRLEPVGEFHGMIGQSDAMQRIYEMIESVAATVSPVMITGESGTGKELVAQAIHKSGPRKRSPFIAINCAAIPRDLLESELFGHEKGAFTGAIDQYQGCFERANKGTLFLDEICEMDVGLQVKLLRLIQEQSFFRIGGTQLIQVNVRILAATNKDPMRMVQEGKFREDLFYRLNVLPIHLPPLRDRREDIGHIATKYLHQIAEQNDRDFLGFEIDALETLENYPWSGNVRELCNVIEQVVVLNEAERVTVQMLPDRIRAGETDDILGAGTAAAPTAVQNVSAPAAQAKVRPFWKVERDEIQRALDICNGNVQEVARRLEISAATLYRKIEKYGLVK